MLAFNAGNFFVLSGLSIYIAEQGDTFRAEYGDPDARLRLVYSGGAESILLMPSLLGA